MDLVETLLGIAPGSPLAELRGQRAAIRQHTEGAWRELVLPEHPGGVSLAERAALALRVALRGGHDGLAAQIRGLPVPAEALAAAADTAPAEGRLGLLLRYADLVAETSERCGQAEIDALGAAGLSPQDIVAVTQLIAFIPFQIRLLAGLRALQEEAAA